MNWLMWHGTICVHMKSKWNKLVSILKDAKDDVTVSFLQFEKMPYKNKKGQILHKLKPVKTEANLLDKVL